MRTVTLTLEVPDDLFHRLEVAARVAGLGVNDYASRLMIRALQNEALMESLLRDLAPEQERKS